MTNMQVIEMIIDLREFAQITNQRDCYAAMRISRYSSLPPLFDGARIRHKLANLLSRPLMRIICKTTVMDFLLHQKQTRLNLEQEIKALRAQVRGLREEIRGKI